MNEEWTYRRLLLWIAFPVFLFVGLWLYTSSLEKSAFFLFLLGAITWGVGLFFFRINAYYALIAAFLPLSLDIVLAGGAKLNFPSEWMLAAGIPLLVVFNKPFRKALVEASQHWITFLLILYFGWLFFTSIISTHPDVSFKRWLILLLFAMGFFGMVFYQGSGRKWLSNWLYYVIGLVPVMWITIRNHAYYDFDPRVVFSICRPYYSDHTVYGACLAFVLPFMVIILRQQKHLKWNWFQQAGLAVLLALLVISELLALSRVAIISCVLALVFYLILRLRISFRVLIMGICVFLGTILYFGNDIYEDIRQNEAVSNDGELVNHFSSVSNVTSDASNLERINRWICAFRMFQEKPLTGYGIGTYQFEYNQFQTIENKTYISTNMGDRGNAHSEYLSALSETGIPGAVLYVLILFGGLFYGMQNYYALEDGVLRSMNLAALLGLMTFLFHGFFNAFIDQSKMAFLVFSALALIVWTNQRISHEKEHEEMG